MSTRCRGEAREARGGGTAAQGNPRGGSRPAAGAEAGDRFLPRASRVGRVMILLLLVLLVFVAGAATIMLLHPDAGYVLINYGPWVVETSLAVLVIGVGLWFLLVYLVLRLLGATIRLPGSVREAIDRRRQDRARDSFEAGLLNLFEGNWKRAEVELLRRAGDHRATHLNYLAAARAAQRQGAIDRRDQYLRLAAINRPEH